MPVMALTRICPFVQTILGYRTPFLKEIGRPRARSAEQVVFTIEHAYHKLSPLRLKSVHGEVMQSSVCMMESATAALGTLTNPCLQLRGILLLVCRR